MDRRAFLSATSGGLLGALVGARAGFAMAPTENRLIFIFLRGGLDGLHALSPYEDRDLSRLRPTIAVTGDRVIDIDGYFGMHKGLAELDPLFRAGELMFVPAATTQYRDRSHFEGQNLLENGSGQPYGSDTGWLNRAILGLNDGDQRLGLSIGPAVPLILQGEAAVYTWSESGLPPVDEDFLNRLSRIYAHDALFLDTLHDATGALKPDLATMSMAGDGGKPFHFSRSAQAAADLLGRADGPRIAVMELDGWDTHFIQERRLNDLFGHLARGVVELKTGLGDVWSRTTVMIVSEFGRTAAENGSRGTDHGVGGLAMLAGGAISGGRIFGDWPGLSETALFEGRDLLAVNSYEALFKTVLIGHLGLDQAFVEDRVFPQSRSLQPLVGILRNA